MTPTAPDCPSLRALPAKIPSTTSNRRTGIFVPPLRQAKPGVRSVTVKIHLLRARLVPLDQSLQILRECGALIVSHTPLLEGWTCVRDRPKGSTQIVEL